MSNRHPDLDTLEEAGLSFAVPEIKPVRHDWSGDWLWTHDGKTTVLPCPPGVERGEVLPRDCEHCEGYEPCPNSTANRGGGLVTALLIAGLFLACLLFEAYC